jgi:AP-3 complex subunit delta-1
MYKYICVCIFLFRLLTTSSNNWMLIKVVKLLGSLVSEEPRLARKLLDPLTTIIQNTGAKSLQYECIHTVTLALPFTKREDGSESKNVPAVVKLCSDYLKGFIEDSDQNLKYLGLVGLVNLMKSNPRIVADHREMVLKCLTDDDVTIRTRALELLAGIVSRKSLVDLVHHLLIHVKHSEGVYRDELISKILFMCSNDKYGLVTDFAWYASVLLDLAVMQGSRHGQEVSDQLIEISLRVDTVRPYAVESMLSMLLTDSLILGQARQTVSEVLKAAAWIVGEYSGIVSLIANDRGDVGDNPEGDEGYWIEGPTGDDIRSAWRSQPVHVLVVDALLHPRATNLPPHVQSAYIQSAMKVRIWIDTCIIYIAYKCKCHIHVHTYTYVGFRTCLC